MSELITEEARRLIKLERQLRAGGIAKGGPNLASLATFKRDLNRMRGEYGAVIVYDCFRERYVLKNPEWPGILPAVLQEAMA